MKLTVNSKSYEVELQEDAVVVGATTFKTSVLRDNGDMIVRVAGRPYKVKVKDDGQVLVDGRPFNVEMSGPASVARPTNGNGNGHNGSGNGHGNGNGNGNGRARANGNGHSGVNGSERGAVRAPMPGTILALRVQEGERVPAGAVLLILEAMKMQNEIKAPHEGTVKRIAVAKGQTVSNGDVLVAIE